MTFILNNFDALSLEFTLETIYQILSVHAIQATGLFLNRIWRGKIIHQSTFWKTDHFRFCVDIWKHKCISAHRSFYSPWKSFSHSHSSPKIPNPTTVELSDEFLNSIYDQLASTLNTFKIKEIYFNGKLLDLPITVIGQTDIVKPLSKCWHRTYAVDPPDHQLIGFLANCFFGPHSKIVIITHRNVSLIFRIMSLIGYFDHLKIFYVKFDQFSLIPAFLAEHIAEIPFFDKDFNPNNCGTLVQTIEKFVKQKIDFVFTKKIVTPRLDTARPPKRPAIEAPTADQPTTSQRKPFDERIAEFAPIVDQIQRRTCPHLYQRERTFVNRKSKIIGNIINLSILIFIIINLSRKGFTQKTHPIDQIVPMFCDQEVHPQFVTLSPSRCQLVKNPLDENTVFVGGLALEIYRPNDDIVPLSAHMCSIIEQRVDYYTDWIGNHFENHTHKIVPVSTEECNLMRSRGKCHQGTLIGEHTKHTGNNLHVDWSYFKGPDTTLAANCFLTKTIIEIHPHSHVKLVLPFGDMSHCKVEDSSCELDDGTRIVWEANRYVDKRKCEFVHFARWNGTVVVIGDHLTWSAESSEFTITFPLDKSPKMIEDCGRHLALTDQKFAIQRLDFDNMMTQEAEAKHRRARRSNPFTGDIHSNQIAAQLTALELENRKTLAKSILNLNKKLCEGFDPSLLLSLPATLLARKLTRNKFVHGDWVSSEVLQIRKCTAIPEANITFRTVSSDCFEKIPVNWTLLASTMPMFIDTRTGRLTETSPRGSDCIQSIFMDDKITIFHQRIGILKIVSPKVIALASINKHFNASHTHIPFTVFHNLIITNLSEPQLNYLYKYTKFKMAENVVGRGTISSQNPSFGGSPYGTALWKIPSIREIFISLLQFYVYSYVLFMTLLKLGKFASPYLMKYGLRKIREQGNNELTVFKQGNSFNLEQIQILLELAQERKDRTRGIRSNGPDGDSEDSDRPCPHKIKKTLARPSVAESEL